MAPSIRLGSCLCGALRYSAEGPPLVVAHCHCVNCQKGSGAGHSTGAMFSASMVKLTGPAAEYTYASGKRTDVTRVFCPSCGSPILGRNTGMANYVTLAVGTFDDAAGFEPQVTIFARSQNPWDFMDPDLPTFQTQPDWKPGDAV